MSIVARPGSPVWNFDYQLNNKRYQGATELALDNPNDTTVRGPNYRAAQDIEAAHRVGQRKLDAQGISSAGNKVTIQAAIDEYKVAKEKAAKRKAGLREGHRAKRVMHTYATLVCDLDRITKYFSEVAKPPIRFVSQITNEVMVKLIEWRADQPRWEGRPQGAGQRVVSNATVNRTVTVVLRELFTWLENAKSLTFPTKPKWSGKDGNWLKEPEERVRELEYDEEVALMETFDPEYDQWRQFQLRSGMRLENTLLRWSEVNLRKAQVTVVGKGDKDLIVRLTPEAIKILKGRVGHHPEFVFTFIAKRTIHYTCKGFTYDFVKGKRYPITYQGAQAYFKRARARAAKKAPTLITKDGRRTFRGHDQRHTFATRLLRNSKNLKLVSQALGHANIKTTAKYAHVLDGEMRDAMAEAERANPLPEVARPAPKVDAA